jgi:hypothetical protein
VAEAVAIASCKAVDVLALDSLVRISEAAHKTGRAKADFELREISREEYERLKTILLL